MYIFSLLVSLVSFPLLAMTHLESQIYDIDMAKKNQNETLVLMNSGQVAKIPAGKSLLLNRLLEEKNFKNSYHFILDDERFIIQAEPIEAPHSKFIPDYKMIEEVEPYIPTTIASMSIARQYFSEARYNPKESQCFNRALIWTYEWWRKHSLKSNKILIYFTRNYIRRYNFDWWFHISPYVHVMDNGQVVERVMDRKYTSGPISFRKWTNIFVNNDPECPVITKFSDYADYPYVGDCYIQRTYMYTYQPADLQMYEAWNYSKEKFNLQEVKQAYLEAFDENFSIQAGE